MKTFTFKKILKEKQRGSIFYENNFYPYSVEYLGEDESGDGSVFYVDFLWIRQKFLEEDMQNVFEFDVYDAIKYYLEEKEKEEKLQTITLRVFEKDFLFLKEYSKIHNTKYQAVMRNAIREKVQQLQSK